MASPLISSALKAEDGSLLYHASTPAGGGKRGRERPSNRLLDTNLLQQEGKREKKRERLRSLLYRSLRERPCPSSLEKMTALSLPEGEGRTGEDGQPPSSPSAGETSREALFMPIRLGEKEEGAFSIPL